MEPAPPTPWNQRENLLLLIAGILWGLLRIAYGNTVDDAFITFAYARNLVEGHGFVFNPGEIVLGTTAPLFGLFVALGMVLRFDPWEWVLGWDVLLGFVILWRLRDLLRAAGAAPWFPALAMMLLVASPMTLTPNGMETAWYCAFILSALAALCCGGAPVVAMGWAVAAVLLRPDGVFLLAVVVCWMGFRLVQKKDWRGLAIASSPMMALPVFYLCLYAGFGDWAPHSVRAKALTLRDRPAAELLGWTMVREHFVLFGWPHLVGWLAIAGMGVSLYRQQLRPIVVFFLVYLGGFGVSRAPIDFLWYRTPLYLLMFFFAAVALGFLAERAVARGRESWARFLQPPPVALAMGVAVLLMLPQLRVFAILNARELESLSTETNFKNYRKAAEYLNARAERNDLVAAYEIGTLRYFLEDRRVFDLAGLITPQVLEQYRRNPTFDRLEFSRAEWFVHPYWQFDIPANRKTIEDDIARHGYSIAKEYPWSSGHGTTVIYQRRNAKGP